MLRSALLGNSTDFDKYTLVLHTIASVSSGSPVVGSCSSTMAGREKGQRRQLGFSCDDRNYGLSHRSSRVVFHGSISSVKSWRWEQTTRSSGRSGQSRAARVKRLYLPRVLHPSFLLLAPLTPVVNSSELFIYSQQHLSGISFRLQFHDHLHCLGSSFSHRKAHPSSAGAATVLASHSFPDGL